MIELIGVSKTYGEKTVLQNLSLRFESGECTCLMGASGCGKSTLLRVASGLTPPDSGKVTGLDKLRCSYVFQDNRLLPWASCIENITYVGVTKEHAQAFLARVGLAAEERKLPGELSGGMQRRLAIARALAFGGDCFFFDEPLQGLDINTHREIAELIKLECRGKTALMITHSAQDAFLFADRIIIAKGIPFTPLEDCNGEGLYSPEAITTRLQALAVPPEEEA